MASCDSPPSSRARAPRLPLPFPPLRHQPSVLPLRRLFFSLPLVGLFACLHPLALAVLCRSLARSQTHSSKNKNSVTMRSFILAAFFALCASQGQLSPTTRFCALRYRS